MDRFKNLVLRSEYSRASELHEIKSTKPVPFQLLSYFEMIEQDYMFAL